LLKYGVVNGRDRNQTLQKDTPNNLGISENDEYDGGCIRVGMGRSISQSFNDDRS
jgi:hypothetical protein